MGRKMSRGKHQILLNYLPGKTFDFERAATIARVSKIRGISNNELNLGMLLHKVAEEAQSWQFEFRRTLSDEILNDPSRFVLLNPLEVQADLFPRVLWCQNRGCGRVFDFSQRDLPSNPICAVCKSGKLEQLRWVLIHRCGALDALIPPSCSRCKNASGMAIDTRGSERFSNIRWICRNCHTKTSLYGARCRECQWPGDPKLQNMNIEVHRAGRTFYAHHIVALNIPKRKMDAFLALPQMSVIAAARFLDFPEMKNRSLSEFAAESRQGQSTADVGLSGSDLDDIMNRFDKGEITAQEMAVEMKRMRELRHQEKQAASPDGIATLLVQRTGISVPTWDRAGQELLEAVIPLELGHTKTLWDANESNGNMPAKLLAENLGLRQLRLVSDFPMVSATYGFSRAEYTPNQCRLRPFPVDADHGGKYPIFVDEIQADALMLSLNPERVCSWLEANGYTPSLPPGTDPVLCRRAYFVRLFEDVMLRNTIKQDQPEARLVFSLLHTMSHLCVKRAALLCGLESTSLSEYILPKALTFSIFSNHRFSATIGALTALYEQSVSEWLVSVRETRRCVYDPVCHDHEGSCHACTHLAETSCRFFNLNLGRSFLFGGPDPYLDEIKIGYFDPILSQV